MLGGVAYGQNAGSNSSSTATNTSGSQSTSVSNPTVNVIGNPIGNGASSSTSGAKSSSSSRSSSRSAAVGNVTNVYTGSSGSGGVIGGGSTAAGTTGTGSTSSSTATVNGGSGSDPTTSNVNYSGSYTVRNTPEVIPPNVMGGNPCAVGASGGVSTPGFGLAMGATWADKACERRQQAALLFNMGEQKVALELMCQDEHVREAMKVAARPCVADIPPPAPASQAPASTASVAQAAAPAVIPVVAPAPAKPIVVAATMPVAPRPEWCARAKPDTEASKAYVAQACGK
jgi:hypothetical protein